MRVLTFLIIFLFNICAIGFCSPENSSCYPERIISLGPALTAQLCLLGVEDKLVGVTTYCRMPSQAQQKEKVGTVIEVNLEKVISLRPDLVVATPLTNLKTKEKLKDLGIRVASFPSPKNFSQVCEQFLELGRIVGREKEAQDIARQAKYKVGLIKKSIEQLPRPKVFIQVGARPLYTVTEDSFINDVIKLAGGRNIAQGLKSGLYSREQVLKEDPDYIIIVTMGIAAVAERKAWESFEALNAVSSNRIYIIDSYKICSPTPVTFVEALQEMAAILHPARAQAIKRDE
ncbi:MAG: ABC transporter substrate-binding protein [Candidatus Omnitrophica bacterium]|nr:ABC transporter substrate-binding protein [Candidatus Omnitrophota bacterium]